jgi:hypothetical protein
MTTTRPDWTKRLAECRARFAPLSTSAWHAERAWLAFRRPHWLTQDDELRRNFDEQERLFTHGGIELAAFVMVNEVLLRDADVGAPGMCVHTDDPWYAEHSGELFELAQRVGDLDETTPDEPELAALAEHVTDEMAREHRRPLPAAWTGGRRVYVSTVFVERDHLPRRWFVHSLVPLVTAPAVTQVAAILPSRWWPADLVEAWDEPAPPSECDHAERIVVPGAGAWMPTIHLGATFAVDGAGAALDPHFDRDSPSITALRLGVSGAALLAFWLIRRGRARRIVLVPECCHRVEVATDDRFLKVPYWIWGALLVAWALAEWIFAGPAS